jgi:hypothetical protein
MTAADFSGLQLPAVEADSPTVGRRPRNFLATQERRRLFWAVMPPALIVVVAVELLTRSNGPPGPPPEPQIDTRLEAVAGPPPAAGEVTILPADEPFEMAAPEELAASRVALGRVRDAAFFSQSDHDAWLESFLTLQGYEGRRLAAAREVGFTEIFGQPKSFRGRPVRMRGTLRRVELLRAPANNYGIDEFWQGWLEPAGGPASPVIVHFLDLPEGMASGMDIREPVVIDGCFFKNMAYRAADDVRVAPLLLTRSPARPPASGVAAGGGWWDLSLGLIGVATMLSIVAAIAIGFFLVGRGRKPDSRPAAEDLDEALTGVAPVSLSESLRRVAAAEVARDRDADGGG